MSTGLLDRTGEHRTVDPTVGLAVGRLPPLYYPPPRSPESVFVGERQDTTRGRYDAGVIYEAAAATDPTQVYGRPYDNRQRWRLPWPQLFSHAGLDPRRLTGFSRDLRQAGFAGWAPSDDPDLRSTNFADRPLETKVEQVMDMMQSSKPSGHTTILHAYYSTWLNHDLPRLVDVFRKLYGADQPQDVLRSDPYEHGTDVYLGRSGSAFLLLTVYSYIAKPQPATSKLGKPGKPVVMRVLEAVKVASQAEALAVLNRSSSQEEERMRLLAEFWKLSRAAWDRLRARASRATVQNDHDVWALVQENHSEPRQALLGRVIDYLRSVVVRVAPPPQNSMKLLSALLIGKPKPGDRT